MAAPVVQGRASWAFNGPRLSHSVREDFMDRDTGLLYNLPGGGVANVSSPPAMPRMKIPRPPPEDFAVSGGGRLPRATQYSRAIPDTVPANPQVGNWQNARNASRTLLETIQLPDEIIRTTMGTPTNTRVNYNLDILEDSANVYNHIFGRRQILFTKIGSDTDLDNLGPDWQRADGPGPVYAANLPTVNYLLACAEPASVPAGTKPNTVYDVLNTWAYAGIIVSDHGAVQQDRAQGITFGMSAIGPQEVFNIWGGNLRAGTDLYLMVKYMRRPQRYMLDPAGKTYDVPQTADGKECSPYAWQIIPWCDEQNAPSAQDVQFRRPGSDVDEYGAFIKIAMVEHRTTDPSPNSVKQAWHSTFATISCTPFAVFNQIGQKIFF